MTALARLYPGDPALAVAATVALAVALLVTVAAVAEGVFARHRPALRSTIWRVALLGVILAPAAAAVRPHWPWHVAVLPALSAEPPVLPAEPVPLPSEPVPVVVQPPVSTAPLELPAAAPPAWSVEPEPPVADPWHVLGGAAVVVWAAGAAFGLLRLVVGMWRLRGLHRRSAPLGAEWAEVVEDVARSLGTSRAIDVRLSPDVYSPVVAGALAPTVYLPATLAACCDARQVRDVLLHECAHVVRRDPLVRLVQCLAAAVYWPHPAVYALNRRLDLACEDACDNAALAGTDPADYAETLLAVTRFCYPVPHTHEYLTMVPKRTSLEARVGRLLGGQRDPVTRTPTRQRAGLMAVLALALLAIPSAEWRAAADATDGTPAERPRPDEPVEPSKLREITGRVVGADGKPVAGADVRLRAADDTSVPYRTLRVASDAAGRYVFRDVRPGAYRLWALAGDTASRDKLGRAEAVTVPVGGGASPPDLRMRPGVALRVRVVSDADGKPLVGARVRLTWTDTERDHLTGAGGDVQLQALTRETWTVEAGAKRHGGVTLAVDLSNGRDAAVELRLPPGSAVAGVVHGPDGKPVPGVGLSAFRATSEGGQLAYTESDANGRYRLDYLPLGDLQLYVGKRGYVREYKPFRLTAAADPVPLDVAVTPRPHGGAARMTVTDAAGKPVPGAVARNHGRFSDDVRIATAGADGVLLLDDVFEELAGHEAVVRAKGFAPRVVRFQPGPKATPAEVAVRLDPGHAVRGRVVDTAGKPVKGAYVRSGRGGLLGDTGCEERTDRDGHFAFDSLPADPTFSVSAEGYSELAGQKFPLDGRDRVVVTLKPAAAVRGRVLDAGTGKPIPDFTVSLTFSPDRRPTDPITGILGSLTDPGQTFAAADGRFAVSPLAAGMPFQATVTAAGYRRGVVRRVEARPGGEGGEAEIRLKREDPASLLEVGGKLLDHTGRGVAGVEVRLIATEGQRPRDSAFPFNWEMVETGQIGQVAEVLQFQRATTGPGGEFRFRGVPPGDELELVHWGGGTPPGRLRGLENRAAAERTALAVRTPAPASVRGTIDRAAYPDIGRVLLSGNDRFLTLKLAADGKSFSAEGLAAGQYEVQVYGTSRRVGDRGASTSDVIARRPVTLIAGEATGADVGEAERQK
ncbi:regulatory protein blar1 : Probable regulatory protein blaR1 OS=Planctomyces maris DSM 8797 GN=PM8797T_09114 PE=4 SV=1: Peptidase_M56: CarboxypepD_reg: CarboxypepD_reg: CarboxypepD_reg: CarboxypepD_reg [Gemmata massiliana]|uniref:Peptidase M56 domain-containing protein n=1 Tax=Gemmata massiliana TaxID=1210884 RepID=A0A6P2D435_9BACT|nr:M56 family metallopeptidase [Gemmata massiliana]VTR94212.1 regulatory protein blar1 : Probable regulatory protein blaR1 OS=Planctomyces maris DSM 8797 GN=PM8797T_09114 PE=4 SV=1: Peptidase_M56: CarboxypepD_reg: CarboxypepD_reg: CarboxypepD_reg: CarboxypepD_reg [Gemmata massiliana]